MSTDTNAAFPDEVVTRSRVRVFDLPRGAGRMALITVDNEIGRAHV